MLEEKNDNLQEADGTNLKNEQNDVVDQINNENAQDSENTSIEEQRELPSITYDSLTFEELVAHLENLLNNYKVMAIREHVASIRKAFMLQYNEFIEEKKSLFLENNPESSASDFQYDLPIKRTFDQLLNEYKSKRHSHYKTIQNQLKANLDARNQIIEELKDLVDNSENYNKALKDIHEIRDRWRTIGPIPKDNYNLVWNDYHFHLERFYDQLHLDREARDLDFKNNLEQKQKLIELAKELLDETDIRKAFRELQTLHRIWKEEIGPVFKDMREVIWEEFSQITKQLHDKREAYQNELRAKEQKNLEQKNVIIDQIKNLISDNVTTHNEWQKKIKEAEALRQQFLKIGRVPSENIDESWGKFKETFRHFNTLKNNFYKEIKKEQQENLSKKQALVDQAKKLSESTDYDNVTPIMKKIQEDWKHIGHVPRKHSDKLWKEFKAACNTYFDRLHSERNKEMEVEMQNFDKKKAFLDELKSFEFQGDHQADLDAIKNHIDKWKAIGPVPHHRRHIEGKFNKLLDSFFEKLSMSKKEAELIKFSNRIESLVENNDERRIQNETIFIQRKIDEIQNEILQLETNVQFISNAKADNPLIKEINKNIDRHKDELNLWKEKLIQLRKINQ